MNVTWKVIQVRLWRHFTSVRIRSVKFWIYSFMNSWPSEIQLNIETVWILANFRHSDFRLFSLRWRIYSSVIFRMGSSVRPPPICLQSGVEFPQWLPPCPRPRSKCAPPPPPSSRRQITLLEYEFLAVFIANSCCTIFRFHRFLVWFFSSDKISLFRWFCGFQ